MVRTDVPARARWRQPRRSWPRGPAKPAAGVPAPDSAGEPGTGRSLLALLGAWSALAAGHALAAPLGRERASVLAFLAATLAVLAAAHGARSRHVPRRRAGGLRRWGALALAGLAGWSAHAPLCACIAGVGLAIGMTPRPSAPSPPLGMLTLLSVGLLGPVFEEILYRELLLRSLARRYGWPGALILSSTLFALPHLAAWAALGTWLVGLLLGALMRSGRDVGLCIAAHAGLNLTGLMAPPALSAVPVHWSATCAGLGVAGLAIAAAVALTRSSGRILAPASRTAC